MDEKRAAFDARLAGEAVGRIVDLCGEMGLTLAEFCHVARVLDATARGKYPDVYEIVNGA